MMSPTRLLTMVPNAPPMMMPTAISTTLPRIANCLNSFSILQLLATNDYGRVS